VPTHRQRAGRVYEIRRPVVVIDFGTAVTYDAINAEGDYLGGAIAQASRSRSTPRFHTAMLRGWRRWPRTRDRPQHRHLDPVRARLGFVAQVEGMVKRMVTSWGGRPKWSRPAARQGSSRG